MDVECRKAGKRFGWVLHSRLEGNIEKLKGYVTHFSVEANTKEAATRHVRRKTVRASHNPSNPDRPRTGSKRKRKAVGNESATAAATFLEPVALSTSEPGTSGADPLYPYNGNVTEERENQYLLTSFSGEKEELNHFFIPEGSTSEVEGEDQESDTTPGGEAFALCPVAHPELRSSWSNSAARALIAPEWKTGVHAGHDLFAPIAPDAFEGEVDDGCLQGLDFGFGAIPRRELNDDGAKLWIASHKFGILIQQCFKDFNDVTNLEAFRIVKLLRNDHMTREYILRTWAGVVFGYSKPFATGNDFIRAHADRNMTANDGRAEYDRLNLIESLEPSAGSPLLEQSLAEEDASSIWEALLHEGPTVREEILAMDSYDVSLLIKFETYVAAKTRTRTKLQAMVALWAYSALIGDDAMLQLLRSDSSIVMLRKQLLLTSHGRNLVRGVQQLCEKGEVTFDLAVEAGWHSYVEFDVLAKFHAVAATEARRVMSV